MTAVCEVGAAWRLRSMRRLIRPAVGRDSLLVQKKDGRQSVNLDCLILPCPPLGGLSFLSDAEQSVPFTALPAVCGSVTASDRRPIVRVGGCRCPADREDKGKGASRHRTAIAGRQSDKHPLSDSNPQDSRPVDGGTSDKAGLSLIRPAEL